jgi:hypothetical protein
MKAVSKILLVTAVAVTAFAISSVPSEAKKAKKMAAPATCSVPGWTMSTACAGGVCKVMACAGDGKWYPAVFTPSCLQPFCPPAM